MKTGKKQKTKCNKLCREPKKDLFKNIAESNLNSNNKFWQPVKPFLTNKGVFFTDFISIKKGTDFISIKKDNQLTVENMTGIPPDISPFMI